MEIKDNPMLRRLKPIETLAELSIVSPIRIMSILIPNAKGFIRPCMSIIGSLTAS